MMKTRILLLLVVTLICFGWCYKQPLPDGKPTKEQFASNVKSFPYMASEERKLMIIGNYSKLSEGISKQQVADILGDPDYSDVIALKTFWGMRPHGSQWLYCVYCVSKYAGTDGADRVIEILFDLDGKAKWIVPRGIEGLAEKGRPWQSN
jgi:hypothetical protein